MKRKSIIALSAVAALGTAAAFPAFAQAPMGGHHPGGQWGGPGFGMMGGMAGQGMGPGQAGGMMGNQQDMMPMMMQMHRQMMSGSGPMGGMMTGMGPMALMMDGFDADEDGFVSADEMRMGLAGQLEAYDEDGSGTLSIDEFETLHNATFRARMVDRFQALDEDGDGKVTDAEFTAPARMIERMEQMRAVMPGVMMQPGSGTMDDDDRPMMDDN